MAYLDSVGNFVRAYGLYAFIGMAAGSTLGLLFHSDVTVLGLLSRVPKAMTCFLAFACVMAWKVPDEG